MSWVWRSSCEDPTGSSLASLQCGDKMTTIFSSAPCWEERIVCEITRFPPFFFLAVLCCTWHTSFSNCLVPAMLSIQPKSRNLKCCGLRNLVHGGASWFSFFSSLKFHGCFCAEMQSCFNILAAWFGETQWWDLKKNVFAKAFDALWEVMQECRSHFFLFNSQSKLESVVSNTFFGQNLPFTRKEKKYCQSLYSQARV